MKKKDISVHVVFHPSGQPVAIALDAAGAWERAESIAGVVRSSMERNGWYEEGRKLAVKK